MNNHTVKPSSYGAFNIIFGAVFFGVGMIFVIIGFAFIISHINFTKTAERTTAIIEEIDTYYDEDGTSHTVYISYRVHGELYNSRISEYNSSMREGDEIQIYYNPSNPKEIKTSFPLFGVIFGGVGLPFAIIGAVFIVKYINGERKISWLIKYGESVKADIVDCLYNTSVSINGRNPEYLIVEAKDKRTGRTMRYASESTTRYLYDLIGAQTIVYINPDKPHEYFVSIDEITFPKQENLEEGSVPN